MRQRMAEQNVPISSDNSIADDISSLHPDDYQETGDAIDFDVSVDSNRLNISFESNDSASKSPIHKSFDNSFGETVPQSGIADYAPMPSDITDDSLSLF